MTGERIRRDLRVAARALWRARGSSVAAVLILAIGIAGTTVMFTLVRGVLLRPLPVQDPAALVVAWKALPASHFDHYPFGATEIARVAAETRLFSAIGGVGFNPSGPAVLTDGDTAGMADGALVTGAFFDVLGVRPAAGRLLRPADDVDGAEPVMVISPRLWRQRFGGADVIGRRVTLAGYGFTIVGVLPAGLDYPRGADVVTATHAVPRTEPFAGPAREDVDLVGRLRPGVTREQAVQELDALGARIERERGGSPRPFETRLQPLDDVVIEGAGRPLAALMAAVLLVLLVTAINAANLRLLEAERRRGDLAIHLALGAGRGAIARQWLIESLLLSAVAAGLGGLVAWWALQALPALLPPGLPRTDAVRMDAAVLGVIAAAWAASGLALTLGPAILIARGQPMAWLGESGRGAIGSTRRWRRGLVVAQVAIGVIVLAGAGLIVRTLAEALQIRSGFSADRLVFADLSLAPQARADRVAHGQLIDDLTARLAAYPGVAAVTAVNALPYDPNGWDVPSFTAEGQDVTTAAANPSMNLEAVGPRHFDTLGIPIVRGRAFTTADRADAPKVAIVSEDVARRIAPGRDAVGHRIKFEAPDAPGDWMTIVGVAADVRYRELRRPRPTLYLPAVQFVDTAERLVVRTTLAPAAIAAAVRDALRQRGGGAALTGVTPFETQRRGALVRPRFDALLAGLFGIVAWVIAAVGVHAVVAASVAARTRELAIRTAIGAAPRDLRALVFGEAATLIGLGAALGIAGAAGAGGVLTAMLKDVHAIDPATIAAAVAMLAGAALLAIAVPMRRAARVDAAEALRQ